MDLDLTDPGLLLRADVLAEPKPFYDLYSKLAEDLDTMLAALDER